MAKVLHQHCEDGRGCNTLETEPSVEHALEPADFELDEILRSLRIDQWFATVTDDMPLWAC